MEVGDAVEPDRNKTGEYHSCALLSTGTVRCWGDGALGRLGYGNTNDLGDDEPIAFLGDLAIADVVEMDGGRTHTCTRLRSGAVRCWGDGSLGRLGYGNIDDLGDDETLASVGDIQLGGVAVQITAGGGGGTTRARFSTPAPSAVGD